jgi:hypothetical protein
MTRFARAALAFLIVATGVLFGIPAHADTVQIPFTDRNVNGSLTFCDKNNKEVKTGKITDIPFVLKYVSSSPAPKGYYGPLGKANVLVLQPREGVDPGLWNGVQMTGSAHYSNPNHPSSVATYADRPLIDFTGVAPLWQGLAQVRMYFSNVNTQPYRAKYPAAIIKVDGSTWTLVQGGGGDCSSSTAVSNETSLLGPSHVPSASPSYHGANPSITPSAVVVGAPSSTATPSPAGTNGGSAVPTQSASAAPGADSGSVQASSSQSVSGVSLPLVLAAVIGLPLLGALGGALLARRRMESSTVRAKGGSASHSSD